MSELTEKDSHMCVSNKGRLMLMLVIELTHGGIPVENCTQDFLTKTSFHFKMKFTTCIPRWVNIVICFEKLLKEGSCMKQTGPLLISIVGDAAMVVLASVKDVNANPHHLFCIANFRLHFQRLATACNRLQFLATVCNCLQLFVTVFSCL